MMEVPVINWPTAFVIAVAMICGAVVINKPSDAAFGGDGEMIAASGGGNRVWQLKDGAVRYCESIRSYVPSSYTFERVVGCTNW